MASLEDARAAIKEGKNSAWGKLPDIPHKKTDKFGLGFTAAGQKAMRRAKIERAPVKISPYGINALEDEDREQHRRVDLPNCQRRIEQLGGKRLCPYHFYSSVIYLSNISYLVYNIYFQTIRTLSFHLLPFPGQVGPLVRVLTIFHIHMPCLMIHWTFFI